MSGADTMPGIQKDSRYAESVPFRNSTFCHVVGRECLRLRRATVPKPMVDVEKFGPKRPHIVIFTVGDAVVETDPNSLHGNRLDATDKSIVRT